MLFLSRWFPYPPDNGSRIRIYNLLRGLAAQHEVTLLSFADGTVDEAHMAAVRQMCVHVETAPYRPFVPSRPRALVALLSPLPRSVRDTESAEMRRLVAAAIRQQAFDVVIASQIDMASYARGLPVPVKILEELELTYRYEQVANEPNLVRRARRALTWWKLVAYVRRLLADFHGVTAVSLRERDTIARLAPPGYPLAVVPNGVDVALYRADFGPPVPDALIYNGALTYGPNFDAVDFFAREILPLIRAERPAVRLLVTGAYTGVRVDRLPRGAGLELAGYLPDIRPAVARSWACVVPLRQGGGSRLKILEALAAGTPVISTSKGAEGLDLVAERDFLLADTPADFAAATLRVLRDPVLREMLSRNGRRVVAARYDWQPIVQRLNAFIERMVTRAGDSRRVGSRLAHRG
ncbi:MAG TPA: glycosyltransferase family 4 protein [Roseiflexaceae bacterium]|nr:glycosyltransferase family 4 protein [Roseiflexaceae bacterium]